MNKQRLEAEKLCYEVMDGLDPSGKNKEFWMEFFGGLSDEQFKKYMSANFPIIYQFGAFKEPSMDRIKSVLENILKVPLLESVYLPFKYKDKDGNPVKSKPCIVVPIYNKKMKQFATKKNKTIIDNSSRDMKTGQLTGQSKQARTSDHEFESLAISGLTATEKEMSRSRGDAMQDKELLYSQIKTIGTASLKDLPNDPSDSLGKLNLNASFIGANLFVSLVMNKEDYMLPRTRELKEKRVNRVD